MELGEWSGAAVAPATGGSPPTPEEWEPVDLPGSPPRFAGADCVAYRTRFEDPRGGGETRALLALRGVYSRARLWLNGDLLGTHDTYFEPVRFVFEPEADNELVVECRRPDDRFGGVHESDQVPAEARVPAIWWGAEAEGLSPVALLDVEVRPRLRDGAGVFEVRLTVDAARTVDDTVTFSLRPQGFRGGGMMERAPVSAAAGERTTVRREVEVGDPERWYPRGLGPQHRYALTAKLGGRDVRVSTGLRTVDYGGEGFRVNGERVPARGFNLLPSPDPAGDVERAVEANANFVRVHAHVPPPALHAACDEAGLLVWQDLPLTGEGGYDIDRGRELARTLVRRSRHHPSLAAFAVHDDPRAVFTSRVGTGRTGRARVRWRTWRTGYNPSPDEAVAEAFADDVPVFPVVGPPGIGADAATIYPGWDYGDATDVEWLLARDPAVGRVVAEFGAGALADVVDPDEDVAGFDRGKHGARVPDGAAGTGADAIDASQAYQATVLKAVAESLRRHGAHALASFALRDTDAAGMGVLARDGTPKAGFAAIAASYEPLQIVLDGPPSGTVETTVLNDTPDAYSGTVSWRAGEEEGSTLVSVDALDRADGPTVTVPGDADEVVLSLRLPDGTVENRYPA